MIRTVDSSELYGFAAMGADYWASLGIPGTFNVDVWMKYWTHLIGTGTGFILGRFTQDVPMEGIGAVIYPDMQTGELTSMTTFWYVRKDQGLAVGLLAEALHEHWNTLGVKHKFISVLCNDRLDKVSGYLTRSGYRLAEMQFRKVN